jgi:UDP-N-acetylmuramoyl-L-alanyl-D-glutamate--2,6-diaminopimelate ligase
MSNPDRERRERQRQIASTRPQRPPRTRIGALVAEIIAETGEPMLTVTGDVDTEVTGLSLSSQRILEGDLYAALPGSHVHGITYAEDAVAEGAVAILTDPAGLAQVLPNSPVFAGVPVLVADDPRRLMGRLAARIYGDPTAGLTMIGVTGTQGKTTTTRLISGGLETAEIAAGVIGTVGTRIAGRDVKTALTTPEAPDLQALFAVMRESGVAACAMEVSSHALVMGRVDGITYDVAVFLNLGRDHLDFHRDLEDYYRAKASLFTPERARLAIINIDDEHGRRLASEATIPVRTFSIRSGGLLRGRGHKADWRARNIHLEADGSTFTAVGPTGRYDVRVPLAGDFNVSNALAAVAAVAEAGLDVEAYVAGLSASGGVPGRLERIDEGQDFTVVVDYAHKPDAVEAAIRTLRPLTSGRVITVIGAGGDRDAGKRPIMGEIAARLSDVLVVTDDNPRTEDPGPIRAAILEGARGGRAELREIGDRREAIIDAVCEAGTGDIVLIAGKGHETGQTVGERTSPFDDREVAREVLRARLAEEAAPATPTSGRSGESSLTTDD